MKKEISFWLLGKYWIITMLKKKNSKVTLQSFLFSFILENSVRIQWIRQLNDEQKQGEWACFLVEQERITRNELRDIFTFWDGHI